MNLLPEENKVSIKKEYLRRIIFVSGLFFACVAGAATALLVPAIIFLSGYKANIDRQILSGAQRISQINTKEADKDIKDMNYRISILESGKNDARLSPIFVKILNEKTASVKITRLSYEKSKDGGDDKILINGKAGLRKDLLDFEKSLKNDFGEQKVRSPISNLLKEKEADFSLVIYVAKRKM